MRVIIKEAVANGRLTDRAAPPALSSAAQERGVGADAVAIAVALAQPWVDVVLSGASTPTMLESNLEALTVSVDAKLQDQLAALAEPADEYWETRSQLAWT